MWGDKKVNERLLDQSIRRLIYLRKLKIKMGYNIALSLSLLLLRGVIDLF